MNQASLMLKRGLVTQGISREIIDLKQGDKIPTITELSAKLSASRGSVQQALEALKDSGALRLLSRGHLGSFILSIDHLRLASICGVNSLLGVMPLPYSLRYEGLATGLYSALNYKFLGNIAFMRGASHRLNLLLENRYDFAVMSALAFEECAKTNHEIAVAMNFGKGSFVKKHVVMVRKDFNMIWQDKKVAIDYSSIDQEVLTMDYFVDKKGVVFVPLSYNQIMPQLLSGGIDAAVWNIDATEYNPEKIKLIELGSYISAEKATEAVLVCRKNDSLTLQILRDIVDTGVVVSTQMDVLAENRIPAY